MLGPQLVELFGQDEEVLQSGGRERILMLSSPSSLSEDFTSSVVLFPFKVTLSSSVETLLKYPLTHAQKCVWLVVLNLGILTVYINHHTTKPLNKS